MGREVNQQRQWLKYVEKFCEVYFRESLHSCCWSNLGIAQPRSRTATHKVTQPLPVCSFLLYWQWAGKTIFMASSEAILLILLLVSSNNLRSIIRQELTSSSSRLEGNSGFRPSQVLISFSISVSLLLALFLSVALDTSNILDLF